MPRWRRRMSTGPSPVLQTEPGPRPRRRQRDCKAAREPARPVCPERVQHLAPRSGNGHRRALRVQRLRDRAAMPPVAPVTSAVLPVRSNILVSSSLRLLARQRAPVSPRQYHFARRPKSQSRHRQYGLTSPLSTLPAPISKNRCDTLACHVGHRLTPAHGSRNLFDQAAANLVRIGIGRPAHSIPMARPLPDAYISQRFGHRIGAGCISRQ